MNQKLKNFLLIIAILSLAVPSPVEAARLYLDPADGQYGKRDSFLVKILLDTERESINTVDAKLTFPFEILEVEDINRGNSILNLWVQGPDFSNTEGAISFAAGIPGGYRGSGGLLATIAFRVKNQDSPADLEAQEAKIIFQDSSQALINDGFGTVAELTRQGATFIIGTGISQDPKDPLKDLLQKDVTPPIVFKIEVGKEPSIFDNQYFIAFSTTDKESGISYYEVREGNGPWRRAESPYLLQNQDSRKSIKVQAIDAAGNIREADTKLPYRFGALDALVIVLIVILIIIILVSMRIARKRYPHKKLGNTSKQKKKK